MLDNDKVKVYISEQVSDRSMEIAEDAFFEQLKEERESRMPRFSQALGDKDFSRFEEALKLFDAAQDVMTAGFERRLEKYFDTLIGFLETAMKKLGAGSKDSLIYSQAVEELYLINCERVRRDNSYRISENHPVLLMNKRLDAEVDHMLNERKAAAEGNAENCARVDYEILQSVFDAKKKNRCRIKLYNRNQVYETERGKRAGKNGYVCARPFAQSTDNTEIPAIRVWEKIKNYQELHPERDLDTINIAVFGEMQDESAYPMYYEVLEKLSKVRVNWTFFRHEPITGEYFFADDDGELFDLLDMTDLEALTARFEIISFLDQNCFYRQGQANKDEKEKGADTICRWNFDRSRLKEKFKDKAAFYQVIYNRIGQWLNAFDRPKSAFFEFDERLYRNLEAVPKENTDIYLYLRYGDRIGKYDLSNNGICNDEYYDGIALTVCRLAKFDKQDFNEDFKAFLDESAENKENAERELSVPVRFWKLLKSVSNEYCDQILQKFGGNDAEQLGDLITFLNESYLILKYVIAARDERVSIRYDLRMREEEKYNGLQAEMKGMAKTILKYAFGEEELYCMNRYFERLVIHSVISNANDAGDLIFAYWIATHWYTIESLREEALQPLQGISVGDDAAARSRYGHKNRFKVRKTIFSMVQQLADLRIRDIPDMQEYFSASFHGKVCPEVSDNNLKRTFQTIRDYCGYLNYKGGYLYLNSGLLMGEWGR